MCEFRTHANTEPWCGSVIAVPAHYKTLRKLKRTQHTQGGGCFSVIPVLPETEPGTLLRVKTTSDYTELQARQDHRATTCLKDYIHSFISMVQVSRVGLTELKQACSWWLREALHVLVCGSFIFKARGTHF